MCTDKSISGGSRKIAAAEAEGEAKFKAEDKGEDEDDFEDEAAAETKAEFRNSLFKQRTQFTNLGLLVFV